MLDRKDIQNLIYRTIENISQELLNKTDYLYVVEGKVTELDELGNCYIFQYQSEEYVGFSITGEQYKVGDLVYVLFSRNRNIKKMILSKTKSFSNNDIRYVVNKAKEMAENAEKTSQSALDKISGIVDDGAVSVTEKMMIQKEWALIQEEFGKINDEIDIYLPEEEALINSDIDIEDKPTEPYLLVLKEEYKNYYISLKSFIEPILENSEEKTILTEEQILQFPLEFNNYYISKQKILNKISEITKIIAKISEKASKENSKLLKDIADDNKFTPSEKQSILKEWETIFQEYPSIKEQAQNYKIPTSDYSLKYENLKTYIEPLLANLEETSTIDGAIFRQTFLAYYNEKQKIQEAISNRANEKADDAIVKAEQALNNSRKIVIKASAQVFSKTKSQNSFSPNEIEIETEVANLTFYKYQYKKLNDTGWTDVTNSNGLSVNNGVLTIKNNSSLFTSTNNGIIIKALAKEITDEAISVLSDSITIIKISDGEDSLSVILTNESHIFPATVTNALQSTASVKVIAYSGATRVPVTVNRLNTILPIGLNATLPTGSSLEPEIIFTATPQLSQQSAAIEIELEVDGQIITKTFSYSLGFKGDKGDSPYNVILGNDTESIPTDNYGVLKNDYTVEIPVLTFIGMEMEDATISVDLPAGYSVTPTSPSITQPTKVKEGKVSITFLGGSKIYLDFTTQEGPKSGTIPIKIKFKDNTIITKDFSWSKSIQGDGALTYIIEPDSLIVKQGKDDVMSPSSLNFKFFSKIGNEDRELYSGKTKLYTSNNGIDFTDLGLTSYNTTTIGLTVLPNIKAIKCELYKKDTTNPSIDNLLDSQTVTVLKDVDNIELGGRNLMQNRWLGVSSLPAIVEGETMNKINYIKNGGFIYSRGTNSHNYTGFYCDNIDAFETNSNYIIHFIAKQIAGTISTICFYKQLNHNKVSIYMDGRLLGEENIKHNIDISDGEYHKFLIKIKTNSTLTLFNNEKKGDILQFNQGSTPFSIDIANFKWEQGNTEQNWSPAPEDVQNNIDLVEQSLNEVATDIRNTIDTTTGEIINRLDIADNAITSLGITTENSVDRLNVISTWATLTGGVLTLGTNINSSEGDSKFSIQIRGDRMSFMEGGKEVSWLANNFWHAQNIEIEKTGYLKIGQYIFIDEENKGFSIK